MTTAILVLLTALAPVPKTTPGELTSAHFVGQWDCTWSGQYGKVWFCADGTCCWLMQSRYDGVIEYLGYWEWDGREMKVQERRSGSAPGCQYRYLLPFRPSDYPNLKTTLYGLNLELKGHVPFDDGSGR